MSSLHDISTSPTVDHSSCEADRLFVLEAHQSHVPHVAEAAYSLSYFIDAHRIHAAHQRDEGNYVMLFVNADVPLEQPARWVKDIANLITPPSMTLINTHFPVQKTDFSSTCNALLKHSDCNTSKVMIKTVFKNIRSWFPNLPLISGKKLRYNQTKEMESAMCAF